MEREVNLTVAGIDLLVIIDEEDNELIDVILCGVSIGEWVTNEFKRLIENKLEEIE